MNLPLLTWLLATAMGPALAAAAPVGAPGGISTLERLTATATIRLGHRESSIPFSYHDRQHQVVGYSHELMLKVVDGIKTDLKLSALTVRLVPVTPHNRIPLVLNGTVDLECGSTTHTPERAAQVAFSNSIFVVGTRLLTAVDSGIHDFSDLAGKTVVVTAGTTSERLLHRYNERQAAGIAIIAGKDHGAAFGLLASGRAAAFMMDDALLYGERAKSSRPAQWAVVGTPMSREAYACLMRKDDPAFKALVDKHLARLMTSGEAQRLYQKWFNQPIPPHGWNLEWPLSPALAALYRQPNDKPLPPGP